MMPKHEAPELETDDSGDPPSIRRAVDALQVEIKAMRAVARALAPLDAASRKRVLAHCVEVEE